LWWHLVIVGMWLISMKLIQNQIYMKKQVVETGRTVGFDSNQLHSAGYSLCNCWHLRKRMRKHLKSSIF
jgi:hypothetical protein